MSGENVYFEYDTPSDLIRALGRPFRTVSSETARLGGEDPGKLYAAAIADYDLVLKMNPNDAKALRRRANIRLNWGNYKYKNSRDEDPGKLYAAAIADCDRVLKMNPDDADAYWYRAICRILIRDWGNADADCAEAAKLDPGSVPLHKSMWDLARREFKKQNDP